MKLAWCFGLALLFGCSAKNTSAIMGAGGSGGAAGSGGGSGSVGGVGGHGGGVMLPGGGGGSDGGGTHTGPINPPPGGVFPIDHVIVLVKENHTFDNYFGSFPGAEGTSMAQTSTGVVPVGRPPLQLLRDLCHEHQCALDDWNHGGMDHWDLGDTRNASDQLAFAQYTEDDIPNYWQYARRFGLADHFFSSMLGPSFPGHMFVLAAQTGWAVGNPSGTGTTFKWGCDDPMGTVQPVLDQGTCMIKNVPPCYDFPTVVDNLPPSLSWKFYGSNLFGQIWSMFDGVSHIRNGPGWQNVVDASQFDSDADNGSLPNITFLVNQDLYSEHPPLYLCGSENWTVGHLNHVMNNAALWSKTAILMTWDDFGGWYDHVKPPQIYGCSVDQPYGLGFRLPLIIVSPYARNAVYSRLSHQASVPKFIEQVFHLPSLASQDPAAQDGPETDDLTMAFDWQQTPLPALPLPQRNCVGQR